MDNFNIVIFFSSFVLVSLASKQIGDFFARIRLPKISGYLVTGVLAGPFTLGLMSKDAVANLHFVDEISLGFIAFAAGNELYLPELRGRFKSIGLITAGLVVTTLVLGVTAVFFMADFIPFMHDMPPLSRLAVALLTGAIMVARSPSVAIAIINELRAKGPFTQIALGVTILSDVLVIVLFSVSSSIAAALLSNLGIDIGLLALVLGEIVISVGVGYLLGRALEIVLSAQAAQEKLKIALILGSGFIVFFVSDLLVEYSHDALPFEIHLEPLLICMVSGFYLNNYTNYRLDFAQILHHAGPTIYVVFFTLVGIGLKLDILAQVWPIALALFVIRVVSIFIGSLGGGILAGNDMSHNRMRWMVFITQAGVALGLAAQVSVAFPSWGDDFATTMIAVVVINEMVGPILFKWAINRSGEAHTRAPSEGDGVRDAIIFGLEGQALALARQLQAHGWQVKLASLTADYNIEEEEKLEFDIYPVSGINLKTMHYLEADKAEAIIGMLSDKQNYTICEIAYEQFGTQTLIVRLSDRTKAPRFKELGVLAVDPSTAMVSLFDHLVRSPSAASLFIGTADNQDIIDIEVRDPALNGVSVRNLRLPLDTMILSIRRDGHTLISHGYTRLKLGDHMTVVGSPASLDRLRLRFEE
ncbi:MAG: cation:proton antiporter [Anaerolineae bacterium]|nr:cation:proton antiporter [Anaerolineae bacterium]